MMSSSVGMCRRMTLSSSCMPFGSDCSFVRPGSDLSSQGKSSRKCKEEEDEELVI